MSSSERTGADRLPVRTRNRRPALAALAILLILLGALGSALIAYRSGDRIEVLVAARDLEPGVQVDRDDFRVARMATDGASVVSATSVENFVGTYTTGRIPEGTTVTNRMFTVIEDVPPGAQLVGITAPLPQRPSQEIRTGDVVALYRVPQEGVGSFGDAAPSQAEVVVAAARVVHLGVRGSTAEATHMTVLLADADVASVVQINAYGQLAVTRLPDTTEPVIDRAPLEP